MGAACENDKNSVRLAYHPDAVGHQEALVDTEREIRGVSDIENGIGLVQRAREEEPQEHQEVDAKIAPDTRPDNSSAAVIDFLDYRFCVGGG